MLDASNKKALADQRYRIKNAEKIAAKKAAWEKKNAERLKAQRAESYIQKRESILAQQAQYYQKNSERVRARTRAYAKANPERKKANDKAYAEKNREKISEYQAKWRAEHQEAIHAYNKAHPEHNVANQHRRRAIKTATSHDLSPAQIQMIKEHYGHRCIYCGKKSQHLTMDHITPVIQGGPTTLWNIVPACRSCNSKKHTGPVPKPVQPLLL